MLTQLNNRGSLAITGGSGGLAGSASPSGAVSLSPDSSPAGPPLPSLVPTLPAVTGATVAADGTTLTVDLDSAVTSGHAGFTLVPSGGPSLLSYASGVGTNALVFAAGRTILATETVSLNYLRGDVTAANPLASFGGRAVVNNSIQIA